MTRYIALLRGVNVGGRNRLPMAQWRALLSDMGLQNVATYIQSGNAVFDSAAPADELADALPAAIEKEAGFAPPCRVLAASALDAALDANPFPEAEDEPKTLHLVFFSDPASFDAEAAGAAATAGERFQLGDGVLYLYTPHGFGRSKLAERLDRVLRAEIVTARNLASCRALQKMAHA